MSDRRRDAERRAGPRHPVVPRVVVSVGLGMVFAVAVLLAATLPAPAVAYLIIGLAVRDVVVLVLWAASATTSVITYLLISRTFARTVLRRRVVARLPTVGPATG